MWSCVKQLKCVKQDAESQEIPIPGLKTMIDATSPAMKGMKTLSDMLFSKKNFKRLFKLHFA